MSSSNNIGDDLPDTLSEELCNIKLIMNVTRENIDSLNEKFGQLVEPPPMYVLEYEELTSKLHELKLKELKLEEQMHNQQQSCPEETVYNYEFCKSYFDSSYTDSVAKLTENDMGSGKHEKDVNNGSREVNSKQCIIQSKENIADDAEHFTNFATSVDTNYSTDKVGRYNLFHNNTFSIWLVGFG